MTLELIKIIALLCTNHMISTTGIELQEKCQEKLVRCVVQEMAPPNNLDEAGALAKCLVLE